MVQGMLSIAYSLDVLDLVIVKTIGLHSGMAQSNLLDLLIRDHGIEEKEALDHVRILTEIGIIRNNYSSLRLRPFRLEGDQAYLGEQNV